jgi:hypothetical protein
MKIVCLLHSLLKVIQELITVIWPMASDRPLTSARSAHGHAVWRRRLA